MKALMGYFREILFLLGGDKSKLPWMVFLFLMVSLLDAIGIGMMGPYISLIIDPISEESKIFKDFVSAIGVSSEGTMLLIVISSALIGLFFIKGLAGVFILRMIVSFSYKQQVRLRSHLMHTYQSMQYVEYINRNSAEYIYNDRETTNSDNYKKLIPLYENAIVEIVTETTALENTANIAEKFVHCVIGRCFPIIIGIYKNVELYRNMGFDMFDDIIDHSYDFEPNPFYRMKMAIDSNIEILTNKDLAFSFYEANKKRLDANVENYIKQYDIILADTIGNLDAELAKFGI